MNLKNLFNLKRQLNKPEYFFNPKQIYRRLIYTNDKSTKKQSLAFNDSTPFFVNENEVVGRSILTMGVYDLIIAESITRILKPNDVFYDVGANIGYFSRLSTTLGAKVKAFEPHPQIFARLKENCSGINNIQLYNIALSDKMGNFSLYIPENFEKNEGIASLEPTPNSLEVKVATKKIDDLSSESIRLLKIDVEGHETAVLKGATEKLQKKEIDFIIFEEFNQKNAKSIKLLQSFNYSVFRLHKKIMGPRLVSLERSERIPMWEPPNFIAAHNQQEIKAIFRDWSWKFYK